MKCGRRTRSRDHRADNIGVPDCRRVASPNTQVSESLSVVLDGQPVQALEISGVHGNRIHKLDAPVGNLRWTTPRRSSAGPTPRWMSDYDLSVYL